MKDLIKLYYVSSHSGQEKKMRKYLKGWLKENVPSAKVVSDQSGIYVTKGIAESFPCVVAHIDEVHRERNNQFRVARADDYIFGFDLDSKSQYGIGADDKNGIWVAMQCLLRYDAVKVALFVGEEIGCVGSSQADMSFFSDCRFVVQCDRRGSSDFISNASGWELCDDGFMSKIDMARFGYKKATGMMTDVMELKSRGLSVAACNLSCGYYNPHTSEETTIFSELCNCRDLVFHIIDTVTDVCPHKAQRSYSVYGGFHRGWNDDDWYGYGDIYDSWPSSRSMSGDAEDGEIARQFDELVEMMYLDWYNDPDGFDVVGFYDSWKAEFPDLNYYDFEDALQHLECYYCDAEEVAEVK